MFRQFLSIVTKPLIRVESSAKLVNKIFSFVVTLLDEEKFVLFFCVCYKNAPDNQILHVQNKICLINSDIFTGNNRTHNLLLGKFDPSLLHEASVV